MKKISLALVGLSLAAAGITSGYAAGRVGGAAMPAGEPMTYTGVLTDASGAPLSGMKSILVVLWDQVSLGASQCSAGPTNVPLATGGSFQMALPDACTNAVHAKQDLWVEVTVDSVVLPRVKLGSVPYAIEAQRASGASGGLQEQLVPSGMVAMFAGVCPTGWAEYTAMRGRFPRGEPTGSSTSLDTGGSDDAVLVSHAHSASASADAVGDHTHGVSGSTSSGGNHQHFENVSANFGACPGSGVDRVDYAGDGSGACEYAQGAHTAAAGDHAHSFNVTSASGGGHTHSVGVTVDSTGVSGAGQRLPSYAEVVFCIKN